MRQPSASTRILDGERIFNGGLRAAFFWRQVAAMQQYAHNVAVLQRLQLSKFPRFYNQQTSCETASVQAQAEVGAMTR